MRVLVLDSSYIPIHEVTWQEAVNLYLTERASVLKNYDNPIKLVNGGVFPRPAVIRLSRRVPRGVCSKKVSLKSIFKRDNYQCLYCGEALYPKECTIDHIIPRSKGGSNDYLNLVTSCSPCNIYKADRTPKEAGMSLLRNPYRPVWFKSVNPPKEWSDYLVL